MLYDYEEFNIYELLDVETLLKAKDLVFKVLTGYDKADSGMSFFISKNSGFIYFEDHNLLFTDNVSNDITRFNSQLAVKNKAALQKYFKDVSDRHDKILNGSNVPKYFLPNGSDLYTVRQTLVPHIEQPTFDHYLYSFGKKLSLKVDNSSVTANVYGAAFDFRIHPSGKIAGFSLRWRPVVNIHAVSKNYFYGLSSELLNSTLPEQLQITEDESKSMEGGKLVYSLGNFRQNFLAPYIQIIDDDDTTLIPLTTFSISIRVKEVHTQTHIKANIQSFQTLDPENITVYYWNPDTVVTEGIQLLGSGVEFNLPVDVYNLNIVYYDPITKINYVHEHMIYGNGQLYKPKTPVFS